MRKRVVLALVGLASLAALSAAGWIATAPRPKFRESDAAALEEPGDAERGRLVFAAGDCASCHASPGQTNRTRLGGGLALGSPFGTFRAPNISSDRQDGIGRWRTVDLANALMSGVAPSGQHLYPSLPYTSYVRMSLDDVRDLMAYLRTLPPVAGRPPDHDIPLVAKIRRGIGAWKLLFFDTTPLVPDPAQSAEWNRGRYLVEATGHCAECHVSRNLLDAIKPATRLAGGPDQEGAAFAPNLTPTHLGHWSVDDFVTFFATGQTPEGRFVGWTMADVVTNTAALPESDRRAMAVYLKSLPSKPTPAP